VGEERGTITEQHKHRGKESRETCYLGGKKQKENNLHEISSGKVMKRGINEIGENRKNHGLEKKKENFIAKLV